MHPVCSRVWWRRPSGPDIPYQVEPSGGHTGTDLDAVHLTRGGVPGGVVSIPLRHMHSPNELLDPADLDACAALVAAYAGGLPSPPPPPDATRGVPFRHAPHASVALLTAGRC